MAKIVDVEPENRWPLIVASRILSDRMAQDLRETRGLAYSLGISVDFLPLGRAELEAAMGTRPDNVDEAREGMLSYFNAGKLLATPEEIETATNKYLSRMRMRRVTSMGQAFTLSRDFFLYGDVDYAGKEARGLEAVTPAAVNSAVEQYLAGGPMVTVIAR
jgi:predicted Zn-dependent peptidase